MFAYETRMFGQHLCTKNWFCERQQKHVSMGINSDPGQGQVSFDLQPAGPCCPGKFSPLLPCCAQSPVLVFQRQMPTFIRCSKPVLTVFPAEAFLVFLKNLFHERFRFFILRNTSCSTFREESDFLF